MFGRIFKWVGCPHGCGDGVRGSIGDHLRNQGRECLSRLNNCHNIWFAKFLRQSFIKQPLQETIDFLHSLMGFCVEPSAANPSGPGCLAILLLIIDFLAMLKYRGVTN